MPTRCSETLRALGVGGLAVAALTAAAAPAADAFLSRLLAVADVSDPATLSERVTSAFGKELAPHNRVFVSATLEVQAPNDVVRFVRLGDDDVPLDLRVPGQCVGLQALALRLHADGWTGGRTGAEPAAPWTYRKGRTQLTAHAHAQRPECAASILLTYRPPR
jgi:hypothetical protein